MNTTPISGDKRPCVSKNATQKAKKKGKSVAGRNPGIDNLVSLMSKNQEMKIAQREAWLAKHKETPDTTSTGCVGAIDGTHIAANVPKHLATPYLGRKRVTTQNILAACDFDIKFTYMMTGWEGSVHSARVLCAATNDSIYNFPHPPPGKYFLVDAGYANRDCFLSPYRKTNYHLNDRRRQGGDKKNELFNYRHASL
ncbi:hypothetical protein UlMin_011556 [Ulmus minor]